MKVILLSFHWKIVGFILLLAGIFLAILFFMFDFRFTIPVFAVYSAFFETKVFTIIRTNFADELTMLTLMAGLALVAFSKERKEDAEFNIFRIKALYKAITINTIILLASVIFIFGSGFMAVMVVNIFLTLILYLVFYYFQITRKRLNDRMLENQQF
ncbi:MAG: hypothetical protein IPN08_02500 [Bacteroidales bacterium]|nr:hypothetical protein [Bacteroidales bacterium]